MESKNKTYVILGIILVLTICFTWYFASIKINNVEEFNKYYSNGLAEFNDGVYNNNNAEYNYDLWSFYYDEGYYYDSIGYCVNARDLYAESNSNNQNAIANFEEANKFSKDKYKELIYYYIEASSQSIEINWAMYEACEYFESASNLYDKELYVSGDAEIEIGNEKIILHDSLVRDYNKYISKIELLEEKI